MKQYPLRIEDEDLYYRVKKQALEDRLTLREVITRLFKLYVSGKIKLK